MSVIALRPHYAEAQIVTGGYYDSNGDFTQGQKSLMYLGECRCENNSRGSFVTLFSGEESIKYTYSYLVVLSKDCPEVTRGQKICIKDKTTNEVIVEMECADFKRGQLISRIWL